MKRRNFLKLSGTSLMAILTPLGPALAAPLTKMEGNKMIIVTFEVEFEGDQIQQKREAIRAMDEATAMEPGCITYNSSFDVNNPRILRIYEMWDSMDALIPHFQTSHMVEFQTALAGLSSKSMEAKVYEVSKELPFPN